MVQLINSALKILPSYFRSELYFPGVEVLNVETKKMMTSFDNFQFDVTDALKTSTANATFQVKITQPRLNHKPFVMKLNISSLVTKKGLVKIYLGPKMMPGELALKKHLFVLLDLFEVNLKRGFNVVSRSSEEMTSFSDDFISLRALRKKVEDAEFGLDTLSSKTVESQIGYPSRLILPKGLPEGLPLQVFIFVAPLTKGSVGGSMANELNTAVLSPGYPLDLPIEIRQLFGLPNSLVKEFMVTHKNEAIKSTNGGRPDFGGRPGVGGRPGPNTFDQDFDSSQGDFIRNKDYFNEITTNNGIVDDLYQDPLLVRGLLQRRSDFNYQKTDRTYNSGIKNQYRNEVNYGAERTEKRPTFPTNNNMVNEDEFESVIPKTVVNDNPKDSLPNHGLLGVRPTFTYKRNYVTDYTAKKSQYKKNEDYKSLNTDTTNDYVQDDLHDNPPENRVEDDTIHVDTPHGLLGNKLNYSKDKTEKQYQYIKKEEEREAKKEQKKEKYINKGDQKKDEYITKSERKKNEIVAKREKHLADLHKKSLKTETSGELLYGNLIDTMYDEILEHTLYNTDLTDTTNNSDNIGTILHDNNVSYIDTTHGLLTGKSALVNKKKTPEFRTKVNKNKEKPFDPTKTHYEKEEYHDEIKPEEKVVLDNSFINKNDNRARIETVKYSTNRTNDQKLIQENISKEILLNTDNIPVRQTYDYGVTKNADKSNNISSIILQKNQNDILKNEINDKIKTIDVVERENYGDSFKSEPVSKVFESKTVHKNINDDKLNKNVIVEKGAVTKKDITKRIPVIHQDKNVSSVSEEGSEELNRIIIYEPIITTELPPQMKRVSVYDFLFNPKDYGDEESKVYE